MSADLSGNLWRASEFQKGARRQGASAPQLPRATPSPESQPEDFCSVLCFGGFHGVIEILFPGFCFVLDHAPFPPKIHFFLKTRPTVVRGVRGVFSGCFAQFLAWKDEGKKMQKQHFKKKGVTIEKKTEKICKKSRSPKNNCSPWRARCPERVVREYLL